jgi:hypothetical protein
MWYNDVALEWGDFRSYRRLVTLVAPPTTKQRSPVWSACLAEG